MKFKRNLIAKACLVWSIPILVAACGGGSDSDVTNNANGGPVSPGGNPQTVADLENQGLIPVLDRSATVAGPDENGDGIRDDIGRYIDSRFTDPVQKNAVIQFSKAIQNAIVLDPSDLDLLNQSRFEISQAINCVFSTASATGLNATEVVETIEALSTNTKERLIAYLAFNDALQGSVTTSPNGNTCQ